MASALWGTGADSTAWGTSAAAGALVACGAFLAFFLCWASGPCTVPCPAPRLGSARSRLCPGCEDPAAAAMAGTAAAVCKLLGRSALALPAIGVAGPAAATCATTGAITRVGWGGAAWTATAALPGTGRLLAGLGALAGVGDARGSSRVVCCSCVNVPRNSVSTCRHGHSCTSANALIATASQCSEQAPKLAGHEF